MSSMTIGSGGYDRYGIYSHLSGGKRITSAADDAAGLAIAQKLQKQETGLNVGAQNAKAGMGALNVADGAMSGVMDYLQRIRELSVRSMNGLASDSDKAIYQEEINQLKEGIQSLAKGTSLNEHKLLDGSMADLTLATNPQGGGMSIRMANSTLEALGIADFDVTGNFDLRTIDNAINMVSSKRSYMGASMNRLEHTYNYNTYASLQQLRSRSSLEDLDMGKAISEKKRQDVLNQYSIMMQKKRMEQEGFVTRLFQ